MNDDRHLVIEVRNVYGTQVAYPINETAQLFARIAGTNAQISIAFGTGFFAFVLVMLLAHGVK